MAITHAQSDPRHQPRHQRRLRATLQALTAAQQLLPVPPHGGDAHRPTVTGVRGMVACAHPLAAQAGMRVLLQGGNAIDAGVAVAAALNVVEPFMSGVGGGGFMQIRHAASGEHNCIDYCGVVPAAASYDLYKDSPDLQNGGPLSPTIPGSAAGWLAALERYGTLSAAAVFAPAIELAEEGFAMTKKGSEFFGAGFRVMDGNSQPFRDPAFSAAEATYMRSDGTPPELGDVLKQPELGATLRALASEGADVFYKGVIAEKIVGHLQKNGGIITAEDLASYKPRWLAPVSSTYRGYTITGVPPPNFAVQILEALNILEGFPLGREEGWEHNSANSLHAFIESMKLAASGAKHESLLSACRSFPHEMRSFNLPRQARDKYTDN
jgi:gamma-glutamyltranspeptidase/glutathione hydrolase